MARTGRPKAELALTDDEREQLQRWARRRKSAQALALRSRIVLACADGLDEQGSRCAAGVRRAPTVGKWRSPVRRRRLDGLVDEPRPGRPPTITAEQVEDVVVATLESTPENATHWSRAKMAERTGLSKSTIGRIWKAFEPQAAPRRRVQAVQRPAVRGEGLRRRRAVPEPARGRGGAVRGREVPGPGPGTVAAGVPDDAGHAREAHPRLRPPRHHQPVRGVQHRRRHRDLQPAPPAPRHRVQEVPDQDRRQVPDDLDVHLICDNYGTHKTPDRSRPGWPRTPGSTCTSPRPTPRWLNQVERFFAYVTDDLLRRCDHRSVQALEADIRAWVKAWNDEPETLHLDQDRRPDPRITRTTSTPNHRRRTRSARTALSGLARVRPHVWLPDRCSRQLGSCTRRRSDLIFLGMRRRSIGPYRADVFKKALERN